MFSHGNGFSFLVSRMIAMIQSTDLSNEEIADLLDVAEDFVAAVRVNLKAFYGHD